MSNAILLVAGNRYRGWKTLTVNRSMRAISGQFSIGVSEKFPGSPGQWPVFPGSESKIILNDEVVIDGFIDSRSASLGPKSHSVSLSGRDRTADMVDCAPNIGTFELTGLTALQIAKKISKPFGVSVESAVTDLKVLDRFDIQPGETAFDCIDRTCRLSGVLPMGLPNNTILLTREGLERATTELVEGKNIISASYSVNHEDRFRTYIVGGQHFGTDNAFGESVASVEGRATDPNIREIRTAYIRASSNMTIAQAKERAQWEATNKLANSTSVTVTVQGWNQENGNGLWEVNKRVGTRIPTLGINGDLLISSIQFQLGDGGETTQFTLVPPGAFAPAPEVPDTAQQRWGEF